MDEKNPRIHFFIGHSRGDRDAADWVQRRLEQRPASYWCDATEISPGERWREKLDHEIASSDYVVVFLTPNVVSSKWLADELCSSSGELEQKKVTVIPVLLEDCELPRELMKWQTFDCRTHRNAELSNLGRCLLSAPQIDFSLLTPPSFEDLVADVLVKLNFYAVEKATEPADKGQVDIKAKFLARDPFGAQHEETWYIETKFYRHERADLASIHRLACYLSEIPEPCRALLVTNGQLTSATRSWLSEPKGRRADLRVVDGSELRSVLIKFPDLVKKHFGRGASGHE
ncbi:MAG TPA: TIR domain-containing protein [Thermoanaerobaculia bacterium]|nr:TIR domain-containing protein [Thermoanaerobaculia bacterium]